MDKSEQYIKMCDCKEIKKRWSKTMTTGDFTDKGIVLEFEEYYDDETYGGPKSK